MAARKAPPMTDGSKLTELHRKLWFAERELAAWEGSKSDGANAVMAAKLVESLNAEIDAMEARGRA